jgi:hypothetical protein
LEPTAFKQDSAPQIPHLQKIHEAKRRSFVSCRSDNECRRSLTDNLMAVDAEFGSGLRKAAAIASHPQRCYQQQLQRRASRLFA